MWELAKNVVFVNGAINAAIYNLNTGDVYSVDTEGREIIQKYIEKVALSKEDEKYLKLLNKEGLLDISDNALPIKEYSPEMHSEKLKLVWLEITQACNMKCVHCYEGTVHISSRNVLTLEEWKSVIDQIVNLNVERVVVIGGEPGIHKNINEILHYLRIKSPKLSITFFTNAYFIEGDLLNTIIDNKIEVKISMYGPNSTIHDSITGVPGSFKKILSAIEILNMHNIQMDVAITIMKENEQYIEDLKTLMASLPIRGYKFDVIREVVNGCQSAHVPEIPAVVRYAYRHRPSFFATKEQFDSNVNFNSCWKGKMVITETGDILPCVFGRTCIAGNVKVSSVSDIISSENKLLKYWHRSLDTVDECKNCEYRYACRDCRPIAESCGGIDSKNPRCLYAPLKGVWKNV